MCRTSATAASTGPRSPPRPISTTATPPAAPTPAFLAEWLDRARDLVDQYHPQVIYLDWWVRQDAYQPALRELAAYYYNQARTWGPDWDRRGAAINYKVEGMPEGTGVLSVERGQLAGIRPLFWQSDTAVARNSWGYTAAQDYKPVDSLIADLVDVVSKNGALLLNIGPRPDGTIPEPEVAILRAMGRWLAINGAAIYGTRPWRTFGEGPTEIPAGGFTDADTPRLHERGLPLHHPGQHPLRDRPRLAGVRLDDPRAGRRTGASRLAAGQRRGPGMDGRMPAGLTVHPPAARPCEHAYTLQITLGG